MCGCKNDFVINCRYKLKFCQVSNIAVLFICCVKFKIDVLEKSSENKNRQSQTTFLTGGMLVIAGFLEFDRSIILTFAVTFSVVNVSRSLLYF